MDLKKVIKSVVENSGGKENISSITHCATRLRIELQDETKYDRSKLEDIEGVKGVFFTNGQLQIIFGSGLVQQVFRSYNEVFGDNVSKVEKENVNGAKPKGNIAQRFVKMLSDIFVPIIPAIVAGGLLMGINNILTAKDIFFAGKTLIEAYPKFADLAGMLNLFANAPFVFLPVLIAFSATKRFGGNPFLGAVLGMIMVHPDILNAYLVAPGVDIPKWNIFGLEIAKVGYQGTVLPIVVMSYVLASIEKYLRRVTPIYLDNLTTPLLSIFITSFITFALTGPILREVGNYLTFGLSWLYSSLGFVGAGIFGGLYAPIVITGMHHSFIAVETSLLADVAKTGGSFIFPIASMSNAAQGGAVLAVMVFSKNSELKSLASASGISALLGITEPAMFGVNLRLKYPFYAALIGSAISSAWLGLNHVLATALGAAGLPGFLSIPYQNWLSFGIGLILSIVISFVVTAYFYKTRDVDNEE